MTDPFDDLNARLIERLYLEDLQEISSRSQHETSTRLQNEDFDLEEEQEFEEAIRLSRQTFQEESLQRATGGRET